jgi:hypothetical protein
MLDLGVDGRELPRHGLRADSDDVAHSFRPDVAHRSDLPSRSVPR